MFNTLSIHQGNKIYKTGQKDEKSKCLAIFVFQKLHKISYLIVTFSVEVVIIRFVQGK